MKKRIIVVLIAILTFASLTVNQAKADTYGSITITGVSLTNDGFVVFASAYDSANHPAECLASDFWWPSGTQYAFWMPINGNENHYKAYLANYLAEKKMWVMGSQEHYGFGAGVECKLLPITTQGNY